MLFDFIQRFIDVADALFLLRVVTAGREQLPASRHEKRVLAGAENLSNLVSTLLEVPPNLPRRLPDILSDQRWQLYLFRSRNKLAASRTRRQRQLSEVVASPGKQVLIDKSPPTAGMYEESEELQEPDFVVVCSFKSLSVRNDPKFIDQKIEKLALLIDLDELLPVNL